MLWDRCQEEPVIACLENSLKPVWCALSHAHARVCTHFCPSIFMGASVTAVSVAGVFCKYLSCGGPGPSWSWLPELHVSWEWSAAKLRCQHQKGEASNMLTAGVVASLCGLTVLYLELCPGCSVYLCYKTPYLAVWQVSPVIDIGHWWGVVSQRPVWERGSIPPLISCIPHLNWMTKPNLGALLFSPWGWQVPIIWLCAQV